MIKNVKLMSSSFLMALTVAVPQLSHAMKTEMNFTDMPEELRGPIVKQAAYEQCLDNKSPGNLALVCKEWQGIINDEMKVSTRSWKAWYGVTPENEHIYQQFLNGTLIYRPIPASDEGMIELKISGLINPLEGTFNLSGCGDTGKYLRILTGYRKGIKPENINKLEIWLAPRFMIEKKIHTSASHLQPIMDNWNEETASIGIFWIWGGSDNLNYDHLTSKNPLEISSEDLFESWAHWHKRAGEGTPVCCWDRDIRNARKSVSCSFVNQNKDY